MSRDLPKWTDTIDRVRQRAGREEHLFPLGDNVRCFINEETKPTTQSQMASLPPGWLGVIARGKWDDVCRAKRRATGEDQRDNQLDWSGTVPEARPTRALCHRDQKSSPWEASRMNSRIARIWTVVLLLACVIGVSSADMSTLSAADVTLTADLSSSVGTLNRFWNSGGWDNEQVTNDANIPFDDIDPKNTKCIYQNEQIIGTIPGGFYDRFTMPMSNYTVFNLDSGNPSYLGALPLAISTRLGRSARFGANSPGSQGARVTMTVPRGRGLERLHSLIT